MDQTDSCGRDEGGVHLHPPQPFEPRVDAGLELPEALGAV